MSTDTKIISHSSSSQPPYFILNLVLATRASRSTSRFRVGSTCLCFLTFFHHNLEVDITTDRILVPSFTRVDTRCIRRVSTKCFKGIEVSGWSWGTRIPLIVNICLCSIIPKLSIIFTKLKEERGRFTNTKSRRWRWCKCRSTGNKCSNNKRLIELSRE